MFELLGPFGFLNIVTSKKRIENVEELQDYSPSFIYKPGTFFKKILSDVRQVNWIVGSLVCIHAFLIYLYINLAVLVNSHLERGNALQIFFVLLSIASTTAFLF